MLRGAQANGLNRTSGDLQFPLDPFVRTGIPTYHDPSGGATATRRASSDSWPSNRASCFFPAGRAPFAR
jgi:hypothetical protein